MKDRYYFPLAALIVAGIIGYALSVGGTRISTKTDIVENGFLMKGENLASLTASPGTGMKLSIATGAEGIYAIMSAQQSHAKSPPSVGVFATLGPEFEQAFAGKKLKISARVRRGQNNPSEQFEMGYFSVNAGDSGWIAFDAPEDFETFEFEFTPRVSKDEPSVDYYGIWPAPDGFNQTVDVAWMKVELDD